MKPKAEPASTKPNYKKKCMVCGQKPTVDVYTPDGSKKLDSTELCGPCCFGEADCVDPNNW